MIETTTTTDGLAGIDLNFDEPVHIVEFDEATRQPVNGMVALCGEQDPGGMLTPFETPPEAYCQPCLQIAERLGLRGLPWSPFTLHG